MQKKKEVILKNFKTLKIVITAVIKNQVYYVYIWLLFGWQTDFEIYCACKEYKREIETWVRKKKRITDEKEINIVPECLRKNDKKSKKKVKLLWVILLSRIEILNTIIRD